MAITREQIEAEIRELTSEADRMVSQVPMIFAESARLRKQVGYLQEILELRTPLALHMELCSFILLGFAPNENDSAGLLCAVTWVGSATAPTNVQIFAKRHWQKLLPPEAACYFASLLNDWRQRIQFEPHIILAALAELSVGPIRTVDQGVFQKNEIAQLVSQKLGDAVLVSSGVLWKDA